MRDLGVDHQAARKRRIPVLRQRFQKAKQRRLKLRTLKIPALKIRLRRHKGGIQPVALWGIEAQGLAPRYRQALRQALATHLKHHAGGLLDSTYDLHSNKYMDPADQVILHHIRAMRHLYHNWPEEQMQHLEQAWSEITHQLSDRQHPWYVVKGPMAAAIAYMHEWQWQVQDIHQWRRPEGPYLVEAVLTLRDPWWKIESALLKEAQQQRTARLASKANHQRLVAGLDWHTYRQVLRTIPGEHKPHLRTWTQAAIHFKEGGQVKQCPICNVPATTRHILWLCKWHQQQPHKPMPPEWAERILCDDEAPLWTAGWIPLEPQEQKHTPQPYQGHGAWQTLQPLAPQQHQGWAFTLDATPSSYDLRDQLWIFGLCVHHMTLGQLQRLGAITGAPGPPHTKARALMEGLVALAKHTTTEVRVIVQLVSVWEAWTQPRHRGTFHDQPEQLTEQDFHRVKVLYVSRNTRSPDAPGSEPQLRRRQRDAALTAWERAKQYQDQRKREWQKVLDDDHRLIYTHAINRLAAIYGDKDHYIHQKPPRHQGKHTKQYKKQLIAQCSKPWVAPSHRWAPHRSGHQCGACGVRVHQALTVPILEERLNEECPQLKIEDQLPPPNQPHQPMAKKMTRTQVIKNLLTQQQEMQPPSQQHELEETAGYLRCVRCGTNVHKRTNEAAFQAFVQGHCIDQPYTQEHAGHSSHVLWQKGNKANCTQCGLTLHLDGQHRLILTAAIKKPCKGSGSQSSTPLTELFRKQLEQASQSSTPDSNGDNSQLAEALTAPAESAKRPRHEQTRPPQTGHADKPQPTPRRLHFPTELDLHAQGTNRAPAAKAMNPSQDAARGPPSHTSSSQDATSPPRATTEEFESHDLEEDEPPFTVEYF